MYTVYIVVGTMADIEQMCNDLQAHLNVTLAEVQSLKAGKKSAAPVARKALQSLKAGSHALRAHITEYQKNLPVKAKAQKSAPPVDISDEDAGLPDLPQLERTETSDNVELDTVQPRTRAKKRAR